MRAQDVLDVLLADGASREGGESGLHEEDVGARPKQEERVGLRLRRPNEGGVSSHGLQSRTDETTSVEQTAWALGVEGGVRTDAFGVWVAGARTASTAAMRDSRVVVMALSGTTDARHRSAQKTERQPGGDGARVSEEKEGRKKREIENKVARCVSKSTDMNFVTSH